MDARFLLWLPELEENPSIHLSINFCINHTCLLFLATKFQPFVMAATGSQCTYTERGKEEGDGGVEKKPPPVPKLTFLSICRGRAGPCLGRSVQGQGSLAGSPGRGTARLPSPWRTSTGRGSLAGLLMGSGKRRQISDPQRCHVASRTQHLRVTPAPPQTQQAGPPGKREPRDTLSSLADLDLARGYPT